MTPGQRVWCVVDVAEAPVPVLHGANFVRQNWTWYWYRNLGTGKEWCEQYLWAPTQREAWTAYLEGCAVSVCVVGGATVDGVLPALQLCGELANRHVRMAYALNQQRVCAERDLERDINRKRNGSEKPE